MNRPPPQPEDDLKLIDEAFARLADAGCLSQHCDELLDRLVKAGFVDKYMVNDTTKEGTTVFIERGIQIKAAFKELEGAIGPLNKMDIIFLWHLFTRGKEISLE